MGAACLVVSVMVPAKVPPVAGEKETSISAPPCASSAEMLVLSIEKTP